MAIRLLVSDLDGTLVDKDKQLTAATIAAIEAQRDFWLAQTNLLGAVAGGGFATPASAESASAMPSNAPGGH